MIYDAGCAAVIVKRPPLPDVTAWLAGLRTDCLPHGREIVPTDRVWHTVMQYCDLNGTPACPERDALAEDIQDLANHFSTVMGVRGLRLRLDVVTTNACRKFHIDAVKARLICTYLGEATQLGEAGPDEQEPARVISVPETSPIVLRGTKWLGDGATRLRHRSPPIEGSGETRLLLVLDPIFD